MTIKKFYYSPLITNIYNVHIYIHIFSVLFCYQVTPAITVAVLNHSQTWINIFGNRLTIMFFFYWKSKLRMSYPLRPSVICFSSNIWLCSVSVHNSGNMKQNDGNQAFSIWNALHNSYSYYKQTNVIQRTIAPFDVYLQSSCFHKTNG